MHDVYDGTGILNKVIEAVAKKITKVPQLIASSMVCSFLCNLIVGSNNFAMVMTGTLFGPLYKEMRVKPQNLSRVLEDVGTMSGPLIPWNVNAVYVIDTLGIPWVSYFPYCFLNFLAPVFSLVYGFTGFSIFKYSDEEFEKLEKLETNA